MRLDLPHWGDGYRLEDNSRCDIARPVNQNIFYIIGVIVVIVVVLKLLGLF